VVRDREPPHPEYAKDFHAWAAAQADLLRRAGESGDRQAITGLDFANVSEEVDSLARSERRELRKRLATIVEHLLKLQHSPVRDLRAGWKITVRETRVEVARLLDDNPSLRTLLPDLLAQAIADVLKVLPHRLAAEDKLPRAPLTIIMRVATDDYTADHVQSLGWWPPEGEEQAPVTMKPSRRNIRMRPR
jgi:hypothetical protein